MRKTVRMLELERQRGRPLAEIVAAALQEHYSMDAAAADLGISRPTLELWKAKLRIQTRRVVEIEAVAS